MKDSKPILEQVAQKIVRSQSSLPTEAGHHKPELSAEQKNQLVDTINQSFELLRINYHHLYFSAYSEMDALNSAKRLWMESLTPFSPEVILSAIHQIIKESDYLPTISRIIRICMECSSSNSLPDAHSAYIEACRAPSPKRNVRWSHPAVYYAGLESDWYFLANNTEKVTFPIFKNHYTKLYQQVMNGNELPPVNQLALPEKIDTPLTKEENVTRMQAMREELGI